MTGAAGGTMFVSLEVPNDVVFAGSVLTFTLSVVNPYVRRRSWHLFWSDASGATDALREGVVCGCSERTFHPILSTGFRTRYAPSLCERVFWSCADTGVDTHDGGDRF